MPSMLRLQDHLSSQPFLSLDPLLPDPNPSRESVAITVRVVGMGWDGNSKMRNTMIGFSEALGTRLQTTVFKY